MPWQTIVQDVERDIGEGDSLQESEGERQDDHDPKWERDPLPRFILCDDPAGQDQRANDGCEEPREGVGNRNPADVLAGDDGDVEKEQGVASFEAIQQRAPPRRPVVHRCSSFARARSRWS
jgi:hypothetical protein